MKMQVVDRYFLKVNVPRLARCGFGSIRRTAKIIENKLQVSAAVLQFFQVDRAVVQLNQL